MKRVSVIGFALLASTSLSHANESFIAQIGEYNGAVAAQENGNNKQATIQAGKRNKAFTAQKDATGSRTNGSLTTQLGVGNKALVAQQNGNNSQGTIQAGFG